MSVRVGCFVQYDWLSYLLQYNPIVSINASLEFVNRPGTSVAPSSPTVPPPPGPPYSQNLTTHYTITIPNVQPGDVIEETCMVNYMFNNLTGYSGRNRYALNPLSRSCTIRHTVHCEYQTSFLADHTATQYDPLLATSCRPSLRPSVCLSLYVTLCIVALRASVQS